MKLSIQEVRPVTTVCKRKSDHVPVKELRRFKFYEF